MTVINPSFEEQRVVNDGFPITHPGFAQQWLTNTQCGVEETLEFGGDSALAYSGYESFEHGWSDDDPQTNATLNVIADAEVEFFSNWDVDQILALSALAAAEFVTTTFPRTFEAFERGAWSIVAAGFDWILASTAALGPEMFVGWGEMAIGSFVTDACPFNAGGLTDDVADISLVEDFRYRPPLRVSVGPASDTFSFNEDLELIRNDDAVTFIVENGELPTPLTAVQTYLVTLIDPGRFKVRTGAGSDSTVDLTSTGSGAVFVVADPGRYWLDRLDQF